jgi:hypothetical protein
MASTGSRGECHVGYLHRVHNVSDFRIPADCPVLFLLGLAADDGAGNAQSSVG